MELFIVFHTQQLIFRFSSWELRASCSFCVFHLDFLISWFLFIIIIIIIIIILIIIIMLLLLLVLFLL